MKCAFCKQHVNEKRVTTYYAHVARKNGTLRKVRWCKPCDESKAEKIEQFLGSSSACDSERPLGCEEPTEEKNA